MHPEYLDPQHRADSTLHAARQSRDTVERSALLRVLYNLRMRYERDIRMGIPKTWHQYVGGARKRLIPFMDEPFVALDAQTREALQEDFIRIWKQLKTQVVFVPPSIAAALLLSARIIVLG